MQQDKLTSKDQDRIEILKSIPIKKAIFKLSVPMMLSMLIHAIYSMTDMFFIGKLNNPHMVAAITICMPIVFLLQAFADIFAVGGASLISRLLGEGNTKNASNAGSIAFWTAFAVVFSIALIGFVLRGPILIIAGASEATFPYSLNYFTIILIAAPFMGMQFTMSGLLRAEGATKQAMIGTVLGSAINIILDPIFIFGLNMGIQGAAVATAIGNILAFSYYILFYTKKSHLISISPNFFMFNKYYFWNIIKIGVPASLGMVLMSFGSILANNYAANFSDLVLAANGIAFRAIDLPFMLIIGLAHGCQPLIGYNYGAKNFKRMFDTIKTSMKINLLMGILFSSVCFVFANPILHFFINDIDVINYGAMILRLFCFSIPFTAIEMVIVVVFQSLGKAVQSLILSIGRQGLFYVPALIMLSNRWGVQGFIWSMPLSDIFTGIFAIILYIIFYKQFVKQNDIALSI